MKIGIFGGAFDPPHLGHVLAVSYALSVRDFDRILIVPCWGHAFGKEMRPFDARYEMCVRAFENFKKVQVSPVESQLQTKYTYDLLDSLLQTYDQDDLTLIIGEDEYLSFHQWYRHEDILRRVGIFVVGREGCTSDIKGIFKIPSVSSSQIRADIRKGAASLPRKVLQYIEENNLY